MDNPPKVRVAAIVPTYNRSDLLLESLGSLLAQTHVLDQIIVVDDGSTDQTEQCVRSVGNSITYLHKANGGKASALNVALSRVEADYVWIFDDDDIALADSVERRLNALRTQPGAGMVVSNHYWGIRDGDKLRTDGTARWPAVEGDFFYQLMLGCFVTMQGALIRTDSWRAVGPFNEALKNSQDYDMMLRIARRYPVVLLNEPTFVFRQHEGLRGLAGERYAAVHRERRFAHHDAIIGRRLRAELSLNEYLPEPCGDPLGLEDTARALVRRMSVMSSKGLASELLEDAIAFSRLQSPGSQDLTARYRQQLVRAVQHRYLTLFLSVSGSAFIREARSLAQSGPGRTLLRCFARGLAKMARWPGATIGERLSLLWTASRLTALAFTTRT